LKTINSVFAILLLIFAFSDARAEEMLNGAGATFPAPLYQAWAYNYTKTSGATVNYQAIGSGGGVKQICSRTVDFGASDDPMRPEDLKKDNLIQFPVVIGGVVPVVNIQGIGEGDLKLDSKSLCMIYLGKIRNWNDPAIKRMNPKLKLPHSAIRVVHRADASGTTAIFTNYLNNTCSDWRNKVGEGKLISWPLGIGGKGNEGVSNYVKQTPDAIGYVEFAYAIQNKLTYTKLKNTAGNFVNPSLHAFEEAAETGDFDPNKDFFVRLNNTPGETSWPIAGATFVLLAKDRKDASIKAVKFFDYSFNNGDAKAKEYSYVPLPVSLKDKIKEYWRASGLK
jgi:phosphate transport system substrate-binding protein